MPRLFTGIELPDEIVRRLSMMRAGLSGAHWIDPDNYHITMRFAAISRTRRRMISRTRSPMSDLTVSRSNCRAWAVLAVTSRAQSGLRSNPRVRLRSLQKAHERAARLAGLPPETRNFVPHVTLARLRNCQPVHGRRLSRAPWRAVHGAVRGEPVRPILFAAQSRRRPVYR